jgi:hypothetical protein
MAVTITRTNWIDDDGTGTTGTVINNAVKTSLYNEIDGALAKVAQLAGGNTFTGNQTMSGTVLMINATANPLVGQVLLASDLSAHQALVLQNTNPGNSGNFVYFINSANGSCGNIAQSGATAVLYGTTSDRRLKVDEGRATDLAALRAVVVHDFTWKADGVRDRGVFAQDVARLYPRAVLAGTDETTDDGSLARPWMTDYSKFVSDLIVGWQQHDEALHSVSADEIRKFMANVIEDCQNQIAALRDELATLRG